MPTQTDLLVTYFLYKPAELHLRQLELSLLSLLHYSEVPVSFLIFSSENLPQLKKNFKNLEVVVVSEDEYRKWMGNYNFMWRAKIVAIQRALQQSFKNVIYLDTDVVCAASLKNKIENWKPGQSIMNCMERKLNEKLEAKNNRLFFRKVAGKTIRGIKVTEHSEMWNAGVVGIHASDKHLADFAIEVCDKLLNDGVYSTFNEQFALSFALKNKSELKDSDPELRHYWGNKNVWNSAYSAFCKEYPSLQARIENFAKFNVQLPLKSDLPPRTFWQKQKTTLERRWQELLRPWRPWK